MSRIGIAIACWNRPHYLSQLIKSLEQNIPDMGDIDVHLFADGDICQFTGKKLTERSLIQECVDVFKKSMIENKKCHTRDKNVSIAIHQFELMNYMSENYDKFIFLEDDVILSPNFVLMMKIALEQFEDREDIFSISPGLRLLCEQKNIFDEVDVLKISEGHFWAEGIWSERWKRIVPKMQTYIDIVKDKPYKNRDNQKIRNLFINGGRKMLATSQDNAKDWAISTSGMNRIRMVVNRATGIGDNGFHSTPEKLRGSGDGHQPIYLLSSERKIERFTLK